MGLTIILYYNYLYFTPLTNQMHDLVMSQKWGKFFYLVSQLRILNIWYIKKTLHANQSSHNANSHETMFVLCFF